MKRLLLLGVWMTGFAAVSQVTPGPTAVLDTADFPYWIQMMKSGEGNLHQISSAFEKYWQDREITPGSGYKPFKRWEHRMKKRVDEQGNLPPKGHVKDVMSTYSFERSLSGSWKPLGPNFNHTTNYGDIPGVGRINTVAFHPTDPSTIYLGAPAGGLWISNDNGDSWEVMTDALPTMGVSSILIDPNDPDRIYIGTGDRDASDSEGMGVWISNDGGVNWTQSNTGMGDVTVNEMRMHPDSTHVLYAAADGDVFVSRDSGSTWVSKTFITHNYEDIEIHPTNPDTMLATGGSRIYRSTDGGETWNIVTGVPMANRLFLAVTPDDPNRVYALITNQRSLYGFYRSDDAGESFYLVMNSPNIMGYASDGSDTGGQSWYDAGLAADPNDANTVYAVGINVWKSTDGGVTWAYNSPGVHVDDHYITFSPHTSEIYLGNDGGIYRSDINNTGWTDISNNMVVGMIYKIGQSQFVGNHCLSGYQDNGTMLYTGSMWDRVSGADGMECQMSKFDPDWMFTTYQYGNIRRSSNGGASTQRIAATDENNIDEDGAWVTPFTLSEHSDTVMYAGYENVWRTTNLKAGDHDDVYWEKISTGGLGSTSEFDVIEHSPANKDLLYVGNGIRFSRSDNCNDSASAVTWWTTSSGMIHSGNINDIVAHPIDTLTVYMAKGNGVVKSINGGLTWTDLTGNLPSITMTCLALDTTSPEGLYVGTLAGIYYKDSTMSNWVFFGDGLPATVEISEIDIFYGSGPDKRIRASTYGRGLWESDGYGANTTYYPTTPVYTLVEDNIKHEVYGDFDVQIGFYKNLANQEVTGFTISDIQVTNGTINSLMGGPDTFTVNITPIVDGLVSIYIPDSVILDADTIPNYESETFNVSYKSGLVNYGPYGPGGVGHLNQVSLWLDGRQGVLNSFGQVPTVSGENVAQWQDQSPHGLIGIQTNATKYPYYLIGDDGLSGLNAIGFQSDTANDTGHNLDVDNVRPGKNFAVFAVAASTVDTFNTHGWIASAREANGFILHPTKNSLRAYSHIRDDNNDGWSQSSFTMDDITVPHIYSFTYCENPVARYIMSSLDGFQIEQSREGTPGRDDTDSIELHLGWDKDERYGDGKIGEILVYNDEMNITRFNIVRNYLGAKYQIDLDSSDLYAFDNAYRFNLAGIGRENFIDMHTDAMGTGIVRMNSATSLEDGDYLLWADNDASTQIWVPNITPFQSEKVDRTWRVDETGDVGTVTVKVPISDLPATQDQYAILTATDNEFDNNAYAHVMTLTGDTLETTVDFDDALYFTIITATDEDIALINEQYSGLSVTAYPSLSDGEFDVYVRNTSDLDGTLEVLNMIGQKVREDVIQGGKTVIKTYAGLGYGQYILRYTQDDQRVTNRVVVVK